MIDVLVIIIVVTELEVIEWKQDCFDEPDQAARLIGLLVHLVITVSGTRIRMTNCIYPIPNNLETRTTIYHNSRDLD